MRFRALVLSCAAVTGVLGGCRELLTLDGSDTVGVRAEFDPVNRIIPFPNNLVLEDGRVNVPRECVDIPLIENQRESIINKLDGFGTFHLDLWATFTGDLDLESVPAYAQAACRPMLDAPDEVDGVSLLPLEVRITEEPRFDGDCRGVRRIHRLSLRPTVPLGQHQACVVALFSGIRDSNGALVVPSQAWVATRSREEPPGASAGLRELREDHANALTFVDSHPALAALGGRESTLLAWEFTTQTTTDILDRSVFTDTNSNGRWDEGEPGSPAAQLGLTPDELTGWEVLATQGGGTPTVAGWIDSNRAQDPASGTCATLPCDAIGTVGNVYFTLPRWLEQLPNPGSGPGPIPGSWTDPKDPTIQGAPELIRALVYVPAAPPPPEGYATVVYAHGYGGWKDASVNMAPELTALGFAVIATDWVMHGDRVVQISTEPEDDCEGDPPDFDKCHAELIDITYVGRTRDRLLQSVLTGSKLVRSLASCAPGAATTARCGPLRVDPDRIGWLGVSLGGINGATVTAVSPEIKAAVFNVSGGGWADVFRFRPDSGGGITCSILDGLISAGLLEGTIYGAEKDSAALCLGKIERWNNEPAVISTFAIGQWILDAPDPINYAHLVRRAGLNVLVQASEGDSISPNQTSRQLATAMDAQFGSPWPADSFATVAESPDLNLGCIDGDLVNPCEPVYLLYRDLDENENGPGAVFEHQTMDGSSSERMNASRVALRQFRTDAYAFLRRHLLENP